MAHKTKESVNLLMPGYNSYGITKGGKAIVTFSDNSDIVTDKEENKIPATPVNIDKEIEFVGRGRSNNMMYDIMKKIGTNVTVGSNIEFKNKVVYGDGIMVYKKYRNEQGKIVKEEVLESEYPEIFEFLENNDYDQIRHEIANDLVIFHDSYVEYIFNQEAKPKLVQIKAKETTCSRVSVIDEKTKKSEWHGYSAGWHKNDLDDLIATPLLDKQSSLYDLKMRRSEEHTSELQ